MSSNAQPIKEVTKITLFDDIWRTVKNDPELRAVYIRTRLEMRRAARRREMKPVMPSAWWRPMIDEALSRTPDNKRPAEKIDPALAWLGPLDLNSENAPTASAAFRLMDQRRKLEKASRYRLAEIGIR